MLLPKPLYSKKPSKWAVSSDEEPVRIKSTVPRYLHRQDFIPTTIADYGTGGAFPEIPVTQYPMNMGRKQTMGNNISESIPLQTDAEGQIRYDLVLHQQTVGRELKTVHSGLDSMTEKDTDKAEERPDEEHVELVTEKTRLALEKLVNGRIQSNKPKKMGEASGPTYVKYIPAEAGGTVGSARIVKIQEMPVDPMEPQRHKHRKVPRSTGSPPPPVLRSPPRKVSVEEQKNWVVPPCISNWKNAKGYTIPLDKRLANDGRGLQDVTINDNFAKLSEALFIADRHAREEVQLRGDLEARVVAKQNKDKEEMLRTLAQEARKVDASEESESDGEGRTERDEIRRERAQDRGKKVERDVSEKVALGQQQKQRQESLFDQRLFNQTSGMSSGFASSSSYNLYDKPLFNSTASIYKPTRVEEDVDTSIYKDMVAKKSFQGADNKGREGPVVFEKEVDVFGVDALMKAAKRGREDDQDEARKR